MTETVETIVIGAGVVGLAVARELATAGHEVIVLESETAIGTGTSARNSEVVHAGIYYPPNTLKSKLCLQGKAHLYSYCDSHNVDIKRCGKLVVATSEAQNHKLAELYDNAVKAGAHEGLSMVSVEQAREMEPDLFCTAAMLSQTTGLVDTHGLMLSLLGETEDCGAMVAYGSPFEHARICDDGIDVTVGGEMPMTVRAKNVVNSAGLYAVKAAQNIDGLDKKFVPACYYAKGNYFSLETSHSPFSRLIYPVPEPGGLGVHVTLDLAGQMRFGPDVEWIDAPDYTVDAARADKFYNEISAYWPGLGSRKLMPDFCGVRPKLVPEGGGFCDFDISGPQAHGVTGLVNLFGIESPGLTACLAIGEHVKKLLTGKT